MKTILALCVALAACTTNTTASPDAASAINPIGEWEPLNTWTSGTCGAVGVALASHFGVTHAADGYTAVDANPAVTSITSTISCDLVSCQLTLQEVTSEMVGTDTVETTTMTSLTLDATDTITGSGSFTKHNLTAGTTCTEAFSSNGTVVQ